MNNKRQSLPLFVTIASAALLSLILGVLLSVATTDRIAQGVSIYGQNVGGMCRAEAQAYLSQWEKSAISRRAAVIAGNQTWNVTPAQIGVRPNIPEALRQAYAIGRTGPWLTRWWALMVPGPNRDISPPVLLEKDSANRFLKSISKKVNRPHQDAKLEIRQGAFIISPESEGRILDLAGAEAMLKSGEILKSFALNLPVLADKPTVTAAKLRSVDTLLATFSTHFPNARGDRAHNIRLAASALDGVLLMPGETLSYNERVGPRLPRLGFREAPIYINGQIERGPGGGICQVSTTLYNTALRSGLQILSRDNHSMPVHYVPAGLDATVAYGSTDLKIKNNLKNPVYFMVKTSSNTVTASVYGSSADKKSVRVFTSPRKPIPIAYSTKTVTDANGVKRTVRVPSVFGFSVTVFREIKHNGKKITEIVSRDRYRPIPKNPQPNKPKPEPKPSPKKQLPEKPEPIDVDEQPVPSEQ